MTSARGSTNISGMFGSVGLPEILMILVIALLIFGPRKLPEVGRTIGRGLGEFRRASADFKRTVNVELALEEDEARPATTRRPLPPAREEPPAPSASAPTPATVEAGATDDGESSPAPAGAVARGVRAGSPAATSEVAEGADAPDAAPAADAAKPAEGVEPAPSEQS